MNNKKIKSVLISGATGVIGNAIATRLSRSNYELHLTARNPAKYRELERRWRHSEGVHLYLLDLGDIRTCQKVVDQFFRAATNPFGLVCNAGNFAVPGPFVTIPFSRWKIGIDENFLSHAAMIHRFLSQLAKKHAEGSIVVMSGAGLGGKGSFANITSYSTAKAALVHLVDGLADEVSRKHIRINAVAPGEVLSNFTYQTIRAGKNKVGELAASATQCVKTGGVPPDLAARMVEWLMSDSSRSISGRLLSARFEAKLMGKGVSELSLNRNLYRLRRIDGELFGALL